MTRTFTFGADEAMACCQPARVQALDPLGRSRQRREPLGDGELAVDRFLGVADAPDDIARRGLAEPRREDAIVLLPEAVEELLVGQLDTFLAHRVAPGRQ